jgi:hypothetical protein
MPADSSSSHPPAQPTGAPGNEETPGCALWEEQQQLLNLCWPQCPLHMHRPCAASLRIYPRAVSCPAKACSSTSHARSLEPCLLLAACCLVHGTGAAAGPSMFPDTVSNMGLFVSGLLCAGAGAAAGGSMLLERWTLCFSPGVNSSGNSRAAMDTAAVYKRLVSPAPKHICLAWGTAPHHSTAQHCCTSVRPVRTGALWSCSCTQRSSSSS